jgi:hypothetical protein
MKIKGAWVPHRLKMLQSPAWAALSLPARRILDRLEIELMRHAGKGNGALICTYQDFAAYGIRRKSVAPAIQQSGDLGFLEVTKVGWISPDHAAPSHYRLTYLPTDHAEPTDEWLKVKPNNKRPLNRKSRRKNQNTGGENAPSTGGENAPPSDQNPPEKLGAKTPLLSRMLSTGATGAAP